MKISIYGEEVTRFIWKLSVFGVASSVKFSLFLPFMHRILMLLLVSFLSFALITIQKGFELSDVKSCSMLLFSTRCRHESAEISS